MNRTHERQKILDSLSDNRRTELGGDSPVVLSAEGVTKRFGGVQAVQDVSVTVRAGEIVSLIGPNGAGKTTLFNMLAGSLKPDAGTIILNGEDVTRTSELIRARKGLARSFQLVESFETMTTRQTLVVASLLRNDLAGAQRRASELLDTLGLDDVAERVPSELALPAAKLLELGKCLATSPKVLLLDEVMSGLTLAEAERPMKILRELSANGMGILLTEHVMPIVMQLSDRVFVMSFGKELAAGSPTEVLKNEQVLSAYLGGPVE